VREIYLPRLIARGDELDLGDAGVVERFYGFDYVDDCAAGADAYVAGCGVEVVLDGALGGGAFGGFDFRGGGGCGHFGGGWGERGRERLRGRREVWFVREGGYVESERSSDCGASGFESALGKSGMGTFGIPEEWGVSGYRFEHPRFP